MKNDGCFGLLATLSPPPRARISVDIGGGVGIAVATALLLTVGSPVVIAVTVGMITGRMNDGSGDCRVDCLTPHDG
jgi:hypothetical protein